MGFTVEAIYRAGHGDSPVRAQSHAELDEVLADVRSARLHNNAAFYVAERPLIGPLELADHQLAVDLRDDHDLTAIYFIGETSSGEEGQWFSLNPHPIDDAPKLCYDLHTGDRFPANAVITMDDFRRALHEFMDNGGVRPDCIDWQPFRDNPELTDSLSR